MRYPGGGSGPGGRGSSPSLEPGRRGLPPCGRALRPGLPPCGRALRPGRRHPEDPGDHGGEPQRRPGSPGRHALPVEPRPPLRVRDRVARRGPPEPAELPGHLRRRRVRRPAGLRAGAGLRGDGSVGLRPGARARRYRRRLRGVHAAAVRPGLQRGLRRQPQPVGLLPGRGGRVPGGWRSRSSSTRARPPSRSRSSSSPPASHTSRSARPSAITR